MRHYRVMISSILALFLVSSVRAESPPDPLRLIPQEADLCFKIEQPRRLLEGAVHNDSIKQLQTIDAVRELTESTTARRFFQLVSYFEKELGGDRWELLDRLAGGGIALGIKFGPPSAPRVLVVQSRDEKLLRQFTKLAVEVIEQELARQESKDRPQKKMLGDIEIIHIGNDFHAAVVGSALVVSNVETGLQQALDLAKNTNAKSLAAFAQIVDARRLVEPDPLAWTWLNMDAVRKIPEVKGVFDQLGTQPASAVVFGGLLDITRRTPFVCAGLYAEERGPSLSFRIPAGREGMPAQIATHIPPADLPGSRPLLEPKGVLFSTSYYLDISKIWTERSKLFNKKQVKAFEDFDNKSGPFLAGNKLSKLLTQAGAYQRIVVAHHAQPAYKITPGQYAPAFAVVLEMREPEPMGKTLEAVLRGAALLATTQVKLKMEEVKHGKYTIVSYRFPEDGTLPVDVNNIRFNFVPCFVAVGKQFVVCSDVGLCRELVDLLEKEDSQPAQRTSASSQTCFYANGGVALLEAFKDRLVTQVILDQAVPPEHASDQLQAFIAWARRMGVVRLESTYGVRDFRFDLRLQQAPSRQ